MSGRDEANAARRRIEENDAAYAREREWCQCPRPLYSSVYLGLWGCRLCGCVTRRRAERPIAVIAAS